MPWLRLREDSVLQFPPPASEVLLLALAGALLVALLAWRLWRRRPLTVLQAFLVALLVLLGVETALRLQLTATGPRPYVVDGRRDWRLQPNLRGTMMQSPSGPMRVDTNAVGLRDRELTAPAAGEKRILCLGDSWTFGHGVTAEQSFVRQLEGLLQEAIPQHRIRVINGGQHGYSIIQAYALFEDLEPLCKPDLLLLCGFNEFSDMRDAERILARPPRGATGRAIGVLSHSMLYLTLKKMIFRLRPQPITATALDLPGGPRRFMPLERIAAFYQLFIDAAQARDMRVLLFDHAWPGDTPLGTPRHAVLSALPGSRTVHAIEVHPPSMTREPNAFWVSTERTHPSPRGHREMARILADVILQRRLLETTP